MKLSKENIAINLDLELENGFLKMMLKAQATKEILVRLHQNEKLS